MATSAITKPDGMILPSPGNRILVGKYGILNIYCGCYEFQASIPTTGTTEITNNFPVSGSKILFGVVACFISSVDVMVGRTEFRVNSFSGSNVLSCYNSPTSSQVTYRLFYWYTD